MFYLPEEFKKKMKQLLMDEYDEFINSYNSEKYSALRINTLKISIDDFKRICSFQIEPIDWAKEGFYYNQEQSPGKHPYHFAGLYYIQEPSAMAVVTALDVQPGDFVLDLCAAPGGKSTQIACTLKGEGLLVSNEIVSSRALVLAENIERFGIKNAIITNESPDRLAVFFINYFDKILVDAPCSGEGMFRKEPNVCNEWNAEVPLACARRQLNILEDAAKMLQPGGKLVYSTCTFSPEENEGVIERFLQRHDDFELCNIPNMDDMDCGHPEWVNGRSELTRCKRIWPHKQKGEGHFIALMQKKGEPIKRNDYLKIKENKDSRMNLYFDFEKENLYCKFSGTFNFFGDHLYCVPDKSLNFKGLKVLRPGLHLGVIKKTRFEPSHSLAMALEKGDFISKVNYNSTDNEVFAYLKGETFHIEGVKGWTCMLVDGYPLGWGKAVEGILKNHYPKGLRLKA